MKPIDIDDIELVRRGRNRRTKSGRRTRLRRFFETVGFGEAIADIELERTIEGASTLTISAIDHDGSIGNLEEFQEHTSIYPTELRVGDHWFALAGQSKSDDGILSLTFEDREINALRRYTSPRKAKRAKLTRAEFCRSLVNEARIVTDRNGISGRIKFVSPESHLRQVIGRDDQTVAAAIRSGSGFPAGIRLRYLRRTFRRLQSGVKWKNEVRICTKTQLNYYDGIFSECQLRRAPSHVYEAAALLALSGSNLWNTNDTNLYGLPRRSPWIVSAGTDSQLTLRKLTPVVVAKLTALCRAHPTWDGLRLAGSVSGRSLSSLRPWWPYAKLARKEWSGGLNRTTDAYEFTRGAPNGEPGESTWDAINRMAGEVGWRCWCDAGIMYFVSDEYLIGRRPSVTLSAAVDGVNGISWSQEGGVINAECSASMLSDAMGINPGACVLIEGEGVADGRWIVKSVSQSMFSIEATVTLTRAQPRLAEPRGDIGARATGPGRGASNTTDDDEVPNRIKDMIRKANKIDGCGYSQSSRNGPTYDCSSAVCHILKAGGFTNTIGSTLYLNNWEQSGRGKYFTVYSGGGGGNAGHAWIVFEDAAGLRGGARQFEVGGSGSRNGWRSYINRSGNQGQTARHVSGF